MASELIAVGCAGYLGAGPPVIAPPILQKINCAGTFYQHGNYLPAGGNTREILGIVLDSVGNTYETKTLRYYNDTDSNLYCGENAKTTTKRNPDGYVLWEVNHGAPTTGIVIDASDNVYIMGDAVTSSGVVRTSPSQTTGFYTTRKYNSSGVLQWSVDHGYSLSIYEYRNRRHIYYKNSYLYTVGLQYEIADLVKYDVSNGNILLRLTFVKLVTNPKIPLITGICTDSSDNIYISGVFPYGTNSYHIFRKYNSSGNLLFSVNPPSTSDVNSPIGTSIAINNSDTIIGGTAYVSELSGGFTYDYDIYTYNSNLEYISRGNVYRPIDIKVDADNNIYYIGATSSIRKCNTSLVEQWIFNPYDTNTPPERLVALAFAIRNVETPPLKFSIGLGLPEIFGPLLINTNGLSIPILLGLPSIISDYIGPPLPTRHRMILSGSPPIELPIKSLSIRKNNSLVSLDVVIPISSIDILSTITARIGNTLTINRGVLFNNGVEQLDSIVSVVLNSISYYYGANNFSASLSGTSSINLGEVKTRLLKGISYKNHQNEFRRLRCEVDTYLNPNDTADLGNGETLVVSEITITVDSIQSTMEISE